MILVTVIAELDEEPIRDCWEQYRADGGGEAFLSFRRHWAEEHARQMMIDPAAVYTASFAMDIPAVTG